MGSSARVAEDHHIEYAQPFRNADKGLEGFCTRSPETAEYHCEANPREVAASCMERKAQARPVWKVLSTRASEDWAASGSPILALQSPSSMMKTGAASNATLFQCFRDWGCVWEEHAAQDGKTFFLNSFSVITTNSHGWV